MLIKEKYIVIFSNTRQIEKIVFMITNGEGLHYITVKKLPALTSKDQNITLVFITWIASILLHEKTNVYFIK